MTKEQNRRERRKEAIALKYDLEQAEAPTVVAKGKGLIADNILERAAEHGVPVQEDPTLVELLSQLDINEAIPERLYGAVAEVFAYLYHVDEAHKNKLG